MTHTYNITGMTCKGCVAKAKSELLKLGDVVEAEVQLDAPQAAITMQRHIPVEVLQEALAKAGNYSITESEDVMHQMSADDASGSWFTTYKPILLIGAYIVGATVLLEINDPVFDWHNWMRNFMAAFFLVFSFFKLMDLRGFANSYSTYDIVASRWKEWGYLYAFVELFLGIAYLVNFNPLITNGVTFVVMSISIVGVIQSVLSKRKIKCACLGEVFNIPMSTVTIIEDALMIVMSLITLLILL